MKKTIITAALLVVAVLSTAQAGQAEDGAMYECTELWENEPTIMLGENWVEMYGKRLEAERWEYGFQEYWTIAGTNRAHQIQLIPNGQAGFYDFTGAEEGETRQARLTFQCEPVE